MEVTEEEVHPLQRICSQGKRLMEKEKKEEVPHCKTRIHACPERPIVEKSSSVEEEKEASPL